MWNNILVYILWILAVVVPLIVIFVLYRIFKQKKEVQEIISENYLTLSIMVPKNNEKTPLAAEQMFAAIHGVFRTDATRQDHLSFEIASHDKFTQFYIHIPERLKDFVEGQVYAQYPTVEIKVVDDYTNVDLSQCEIAATELKITKEDVYPIKTFLSFEVDPLAGITGVLSKVEHDEKIWIQILARPVDDSWQDRGVQLVKNIRSGIDLSGGIWGEFKKVFKELLLDVPRHLISPPSGEEKKDEGGEKKLPGPQETAMGAIEMKVQKLGFEAKIRIMSIASDEKKAKDKLMSVVGAFKQFNATNINGFVAGSITSDKDILTAFQLRAFGGDGYVFNIEELASIYHFPHVSVETPSIVWAGSKKGEPPANLPIEGIVPSDDLTVFAETNFRHYQHRFGLKMRDRRLHTYVIGKTGTGKSNLQQTMIIDDIKEGRGVAVVDPHGDLIKHVLNFIPQERIQDVVYLNPADHDFPIGFNLLENVDPDLKNIVASGLMSVFTKLWEGVWSARMEYILRNCVLALLEYPGSTFLGIMRLLTDKKFRTEVLSHVKDPVIQNFFINEYEKYDAKFRTEAIAPIQNKVGQFLSTTTIRNIVGQQHSTINMKDIMNSGKILLIDLTIGRIGEDNSALLGGMLITKIQLAAMERANVAEEQRRDFYLYVDEFQNFATESFAVILSEARKYHLNLVLANQYIAQLNEKVADAIFGNIGTMIAFRVGAADAEAMVKEFEPIFDANDLVNLPNYHIYIKMAIDGVTRPAFSAVTLPPRDPEHSYIDEIIDWSRQTYGRPVEQVEEEILESAGDQLIAVDEQGKMGESESLVIGGEVFQERKVKDGDSWYEITEQKIEDGVPGGEEGEATIEETPPSDAEYQLVEENRAEPEHLISQDEAHEVIGSREDSDQNKETVIMKEGETVNLNKDSEIISH